MVLAAQGGHTWSMIVDTSALFGPAVDDLRHQHSHWFSLVYAGVACAGFSYGSSVSRASHPPGSEALATTAIVLRLMTVLNLGFGILARPIAGGSQVFPEVEAARCAMVRCSISAIAIVGF